MPNRLIKESICTSDNLDRLSWFEEAFFFRLIVNCDDYGRMDARPAILRARLFPLKTVTDTQVAKALQSLRSADMIDIYDVDGRSFLQMRTWEKHQQVRAKRSKYPAPEDDVKSSDIKCNQVQANVPVIQSESVSESESNPREKRARAHTATTAAAEPVTAFDGSDMTEAIATQREIARLIKRYRLPDNDVSMDALLEDSGKYGIECVKGALERASLADNRGGISIKYYRTFLDAKPRPAPNTGASGGTQPPGTTNPFLQMMREEGYA